MKIDRVIFAWDGNPLFDGMFDLQVRAWEKLGVSPTLLFVGESALSVRGSHVISLRSAPHLPHGDLNWQAPMALIYGARMWPGEVVMTSGLDQVPLSRRFLDAVEPYPIGHFVVGFGGCRHYDGHEATYGCRYYPSSHMVAHSNTWREILRGTPSSYPEFLEWAWNQRWPYMWEHVSPGWGMDEAAISQLLARSKVPIDVFSPEFFNRWDADRVGRCAQVADLAKVARGEYSEIHFNRPLQPAEARVVEHFATP